MVTVQEKWMLKSKTVWGVILMGVPTLLTVFGVSLPEGSIENADTLAKHAIEAIGAALALYGRFAAGGVRLTP